MSIRLLSEDVRAQIKSSVQVTSIGDVIEELYRNGVDAGASSVNIVVDFAKGFCSVEDDGSGIASREFQEGGHLAQVHCWCLESYHDPADRRQARPNTARLVLMESMGAFYRASLPFPCFRSLPAIETRQHQTASPSNDLESYPDKSVSAI